MALAVLQKPLTWICNPSLPPFKNAVAVSVQTYQTALVTCDTLFLSVTCLASLGTHQGSPENIRLSAHLLNKATAETFIAILNIFNSDSPGLFGLKGDNVNLSNYRIKLCGTSTFLRSFAIWQNAKMAKLCKGGFVSRHFIARIAAPVTGVLGAVAAAACMALGMVGAVFAVLSLGRYKLLNEITYQLLANPGFIINQLTCGILGFFRPSIV